MRLTVNANPMVYAKSLDQTNSCSMNEGRQSIKIEADGISVVIPVYNSAEALPELVERLYAVLSATGKQFESILVNDGSNDRSWEIICDLAAQFDWIHGICLMRNYGQHNALLCGIRAAHFNITITMDDDLQHLPEEIPKLITTLNAGFDVVYGVPFKLQHSITRNILSRTTKLLMSMAVGTKVIEEVNAFRAIRTSLRKSFADFHGPDLLLDALFGWGTTKFASVSVRHNPRKFGTSNYTAMKLINQFLLLLTGYSTAPLRFGALLGFFFTLFGFMVLTYIMAVRILYGSPLGFAFQASLFTVLGGVQLFILGIMGEYLARMFRRIIDCPTYTIREIVQKNLAD